MIERSFHSNEKNHQTDFFLCYSQLETFPHLPFFTDRLEKKFQTYPFFHEEKAEGFLTVCQSPSVFLRGEEKN